MPINFPWLLALFPALLRGRVGLLEARAFLVRCSFRMVFLRARIFSTMAWSSGSRSRSSGCSWM